MLVFLLLCSTVNAQSNRVDSLLNRLKKEPKLSQAQIELNYQLSLCQELAPRERYDHMLKASLIARKIGDKRQITQTYSDLIGASQNASYPDSMLIYANLTIKNAKEYGFKDLELYAYSLKGFFYANNKSPDYRSAASYFNKSYELAVEISDSSRIIDALPRILNQYKRLRDTSQCRRYSRILLNVIQSWPRNSVNELAYTSLSDYYREVNSDFDSSLLVLQWAVPNYDDISDANVAWRAGLALSFAKYYYKVGEMQKAHTYANLALSKAKTLGSVYDRSAAHHMLFVISKQMENYEDALLNYEELRRINDSLDARSLDDSKRAYDAYNDRLVQRANIEKERNQRLWEAERNKNQLFFIISVGILVALSSIFLFVAYSRKRKQLRLSEELQRLLESEKERAEKSEAFKQQFLANMSHEIRTPMSAVLGMTELVMQTDLNDKQKQYLGHIQQSADRLLYVINQILDLAKIEKGQIELERIVFSLADLTEQLRLTVSNSAEEKGLDLIIDYPEDLEEEFIGDPIRLYQVLLNLLNNAIKFTNQGSVVFTVSKSKDGIQFEVTDTGVGIPENRQASIFENFVQANTSDFRTHGGTGLGLSISKQLVELMGGELKLISEYKQGSTFSFTIPLQHNEKEPGSTKIPEDIDWTRLEGLTILIADDTETNRIIARDSLAKLPNVQIIEATNGKEVLALINSSVDLVLMDIHMPVMDGLSATECIRSKKDSPVRDVKIIGFSASIDANEVEACLAVGMDGFLRKPFKIIELIKAVQGVLPVNDETDDQELIDKDHLTLFCDNDSKLIEKYKDMFLSEGPQFIVRSHQLMEEKKYDDLANDLHRFATKLNLMGMKPSATSALNLENSLRESNMAADCSEALRLLLLEIEKGIEYYRTL